MWVLSSWELPLSAIPVKNSRRTDDRFPLHNLDLPGGADILLMCVNDLAHVAGWEPYNLHYLLEGRVSWVGSVVLQILQYYQILHYYRSCSTTDPAVLRILQYYRSCSTTDPAVLQIVHCTSRRQDRVIKIVIYLSDV